MSKLESGCTRSRATNNETTHVSTTNHTDQQATSTNVQSCGSDENRDGAWACVPEDVDAVVVNPPWGKRIGNLSLEHSEEGAIVRSLLSQFVRNSHYHNYANDAATYQYTPV